MANLIRYGVTRLFPVMSCLAILACSQGAAPPSTEYEPESVSISPESPQCPNLSGTYRLLHGSHESRIFSQYSLPSHEMDMVQLALNPSNGTFTYRLKMDETRFVEQVSKLRSSAPEAYATWRELITQWQQQKNSHQETSVLEGKILQVGPLPERGGQLIPRQCEAYWGMIANPNFDLPVVNSKSENEDSVETETRLSRGKNAALLVRYDTYRTTRFMFGSDMRTGIIKSDYAKLLRVPPNAFVWEVTDSIAPKPYIQPQAQPVPTVTNSNADLPAILVDVQQYAMGHLPTGGQISEFVLDKSSAEFGTEQNPRSSATTQNTVHWVSMKGETNSNQEISDFMRAMMLHPQLENVELVSVQQTEANKIEFVLRLKLKN